MKKTIVITTIFSPTDAVKDFSLFGDYDMIVVGDKKTPSDWSCENVNYLSVETQNKSDYKLAAVMPFNHYCRKMLGYLEAMKNGAEAIIDTDDDNYPKPDWQFPDFQGEFNRLEDDLGFINIYQLFTSQKIWPRGMPLQYINQDFDLTKKLCHSLCNIGVWQGLADDNPDVDAIYRLTSDAPCHFEKRRPVVLGKGTITPFNTQNTMIRKELFPLMYLPTYVTFRFTDILRGLVAQPIMWLHGFNLGYIDATVIQKRNPHDYMNDFVSEVPMYEHCEKAVELVGGAISSSNSMTGNLFAAYEALLKAGIVCQREMQTLEAWISDVEKLLIK